MRRGERGHFREGTRVGGLLRGQIRHRHDIGCGRARYVLRTRPGLTLSSVRNRSRRVAGDLAARLERTSSGLLPLSRIRRDLPLSRDLPSGRSGELSLRRHGRLPLGCDGKLALGRDGRLAVRRHRRLNRGRNLPLRREGWLTRGRDVGLGRNRRPT